MQQDVYIFSIDRDRKQSAASTALRFMQRFYNAPLSTGCTLIPCMGYWKGQREYSFVCSSSMFHDFVLPSGAVNEQECFLRITKNDEVRLVHNAEGMLVLDEPYGVFKLVSEKVAKQQSGWTYLLEADEYWIVE